MALPPAFLDELRARLSLSQVAGRKVTWDLRKTNQGKGDWWAPCPFHQEKSASFHVDDRKGFFYCFGCQAKGDLFGFVMQSENLGFMEAVEVLAREAGMTMPARDPASAARADRRAQLSDVTEMAARWYRTQLGGAGAREARRYLDGRGLAPATLERFEIGYAPGGRDALRQHLLNKDVPPAMIEEAGLVATPDDGRAPYDRMRDRVIFPIRDGRGRCLGFGGRALSDGAKAKYLNSPETPLFDKGATLYNLRDARAAVGRSDGTGGRLVVAEGYMDVIALAQAGIEGAVAPLGTAITETQLRMLWQAAPEPVVALDGDAAGLRAALRLADLALPVMVAGQSLRFALMPEGQDPDDVIRAGGRAAMEAALDAAQPMVALLWRRVAEGRTLDSPERRAMLDRDLRALVERVEDRSLRRHYAAELARLREALLGPVAVALDPRRRAPWRGRRPPPPRVPTATARASALASGEPGEAEARLEEVALAGLVLRPALVEEFAVELERTRWSREAHARIADALLMLDPVETPEEALRHLRERVGADALDFLLGRPHVRVSPVARAEADDEAVARCVRDTLRRLEARRGRAREVAEAREDYADGADETLTWRLRQAGQRAVAADRAPRDAAAQDEEAEAEMSIRLQAMIDGRVWERRRK
jgi:DNA primase